MKPQRYRIQLNTGLDGLRFAVALVPDDNGNMYLAADVDALLARIRAAVEAEREVVEQDAAGFARGTGGRLHAVYSARAALDALLADGGA